MEIKSGLVVYLSGPMSGLPEMNYPAFHAAAKKLRDAGVVVENPAENQPPECGTWAGYMRMALVQMLRCEAVVMLPNWQFSRGARIERQLASDLGIRVLVLDRDFAEVAA